jgi:hypothetical protein
MTTFEYIKKCIEHGHRVAVKDKDGFWCVFMSINGFGFLEGTISNATIKTSLYFGGSCEQYSEKEFIESFTDEIKVLPQRPKPFKVGDKVRVHEILRECKDFEDWFGEKKMMVNKESVITEVLDDEDGISYTLTGSAYAFPHYCLIPVREEAQEMTLEEVCKELGREIKIKK